MLKRTILTASLCMALIGGAQCAMAEPAGNPDQAEAKVEQVLADGQEALAADDVSSAEVNTVEESATVRKMTKAEKNEDVKKNDGYGLGLTILAMCLVLFALIVLSLLFQCFGKISEAVLASKKRKAKGLTRAEAPEAKDLLASGETIAAIAAAIAEHLDQDHDLEDTILTIRRMKRAYSPWNSKIYNMRVVPELRKNVRR